ncbi:arylsulfatase A-like enzyme [Catalinimonas alkaloidigena]|uniref:arylsulfatase n=1 Tax=Catalinimonas alkaloidigena TaxID=1075417 RepID=UPI002405F824|nr:arylsulfatase [Catalinimonas alkaloidigena]MDF9798743.1 arylsulfatase A-like enzyme [Catalinimonas alkaloidigena]
MTEWIMSVKKSLYFKIAFFVFLSISLIACQPSENTQNEEGAASQPNVIFIITDDQGYGDIAAHGNPWIKTPNMDALHAQSARFTNFHVGTTCAPTRSGIMTGVHCNRVGVWHTIIGRSLLKEGFPTMAEVFQDNGYRTGIFGKWHLGDNYPFRPQDNGFEEVVVHGGGGVGQTPDYWNNDYFDDTYYHNGKPEKYEGYCTDVWFSEAIRFVEENQDQPFFCYISTNAPHSPFHVPQSYIDMYANNPDIPNPNFYGMISNIDDNLGLLEKKLEELGLRENTVLVFMTDNGTSAGVNLDQQSFPQNGFNAGMRGKKGSPYDGGHRVPLFIRWPEGNVPEGKDVDEISAYTDILPSLIDLCGLDMEVAGVTPQSFFGKSLVRLIREDEPIWEERTLVTDTQRGEMLQKGKNAAVMTNRWRLVYDTLLFDMENDPGQTQNLIDEYPEVADKLRQDYEAWWTKVSEDAEQYARIIIGNEKAESVTLTCHDFHPTQEGYPAWNQELIRNAQNNQGYWTLEVAEAGDYRIELSRWPKEADALISGTVARGDQIPGGEAYSVGKALPLTEAGIQIGEHKASSSIEDDQKLVGFEINLPAGKTELLSWYKDQQGNTYGGYYVYITKL